nr:hypothetical protein CFP56_67130 [Quercus suber]
MSPGGAAQQPSPQKLGVHLYTRLRFAFGWPKVLGLDGVPMRFKVYHGFLVHGVFCVTYQSSPSGFVGFDGIIGLVVGRVGILLASVFVGLNS